MYYRLRTIAVAWTTPGSALPVIVLPDRLTLGYWHLPKSGRPAAGISSSRTPWTTAKFPPVIVTWHR
jgi:hypothetical protein